MKCPRQISMPPGVQLWLEEQLKARGFDVTVYSKYILRLLYNDASDFQTKPKDCGVRNLVDELSAKLKGFEERGQSINAELTTAEGLGDNHPQFLPEKALRHHSVFPPLSSKTKTDHICSSLGSSSSVCIGKHAFGTSIGKNRTFSEGNNRESKFSNQFDWLEENKENNGCNKDVKEKMRSRSTVKQQTPEKYRNMAKSLDRKDDFNRKSEVSKNRRLYQQSNELASEHVEILWGAEKSFDDLAGCDLDLPMDFQQLLESPEATKMSLDFSRCPGTVQPSSFIQCGTNITSSIWSEKAEDTMDCSIIGETNNELNINSSFSKSAWGVSNDASLNRRDMLQDSDGQLKPNIWSTGENGIFGNDSWKTVGKTEKIEQSAKLGNWSDIEGTHLLLNDTDKFFSSIDSNLHISLSTLNHNKKDSSFTEVIPKVPSSGFTTAKDCVIAEPVVTHTEGTSSRKEEEDLLTSMRTHFRPIKQESIEVVPSTTVPTFPDGTTFPISNSLDEPNFHRSPGGGFYLDSDINSKYMEFNDAEDDNPSEFIPKFRVRQNEKFCQTEELVLPSQNSGGSDCEELFFPEDEKLVRRMVEEDEVEEEDENVFWGGETFIKVDGWVTTWPTSGIWSNEPNVQQIWCGGNVWNTANDSVDQEKPVANSSDNTVGEGVVGGGGDQYTQLRNEWTQEAEELLSDISQHLYLANYMDTQPSKSSLVESAWNQLSATPFSRTLPLPPSYSVMQS